MKESDHPFLGISNGRWLLIAAVSVAASVYAWREWVPFRLDLPAIGGQLAVDPRSPLTIEAVGFGTRLSQVELRDTNGKTIAAMVKTKDATFAVPLEFGTRYVLTATAERPWLAQQQTRELSFQTVEIPKLEGATVRNLDPESSVTLHFDRPVTQVETSGSIRMDVQQDPSGQSVKLVAHDFAQGETIPLEVHYQTATGVPVPPVQLEIATAPPLTAEINISGKTELGLAMPVEFSFSEPLANRETAGQSMTVQTEDGKDVAGKWKWYNKHRLQFIPEPNWPVQSKVTVSVVNPGNLRSVQGGTMETAMTANFTTGADKRIEVDLSTQRAHAIENGQIVKTFRISSGKAGTPTAQGNFYIYARFPLKTMKSRAKPGQKGHYVVENVPYAQYFYDTYAFHGAWWHNGFGHPASHGCVNMSTRKHNHRWPNASEDAGWLYQWANLGVPVWVHHGATNSKVAMQ